MQKTASFSVLFMAVLAVLLFATPHDAAARRAVPQSQQQVQLSYAPVVKQAAPAVVNIYTTRRVRSRRVSPLFNDPFFNQFFGGAFGGGMLRERVERSLGSGVIVRPDGMIVTNSHVIAGAEEIIIALSDGRVLKAEILLEDERADLAVLKAGLVEESLPYLKLDDSNKLEVGDIVLAIGNPFGVGQTVTSGIVSAIARTSVGIADFNSFIQTDAAINPGNSGGALVGLDGGLVGINTAIYSRDGGSNGIGFAVPANMVRTLLDAAQRGDKYIVRAWFGGQAQAITPDIAEGLELATLFGALIADVYEDGPAAKAGLKPGDVVTRFGDVQVNDPEMLKFQIATLPLGKTAKLTVLRKGKVLALNFKAVPPPEDPPRNETRLSGRNPLDGALVANISPALIEETGLSGASSGVVVLDVEPRGNAASLGVREGDVVINVNGEEIKSVRQLAKVLGKYSATRWRLQLLRRGQLINLMVRG